MLTQTPKQAPGEAATSRWSGYYAGYSTEFVRDALAFLDANGKLGEGAIVLDPWNGSGTTTEVTHLRGIDAIGIDVNPAIVIVAKARLLRSDVKPSHLSICTTVLRAARRFCENSVSPEDPLLWWFTPSAATSLRGVERAIQHVLVPNAYRRITTVSMAEVSALAAAFYVALFRATRSFLGRFGTSNPTWTKTAQTPSHRLRPSRQDVFDAFRACVARFFHGLDLPSASTRSGKTIVDVGDSTSLPNHDGSVSAVIASPPYCTRIDYAVATKPELAVLGVTSPEFDQLRRRMMGCPLISGTSPPMDEAWGSTCLEFLARVQSHPSHGSRSYYFPTHADYYSQLHASFTEIARVIREGGQAIFVVQDSYYKDVHNDLQAVTIEMLQRQRLQLIARRDHHLPITKAAVNTRHKKYRTSCAAVESVMVFEKN